MTWRRKLVLGYLALVSIVFLAGYVILSIREMGLYLFLIAVNLPSSLAVVPQMAALSQSLGWILGSPAHILATQLACMAVNGVLLAAIVAIASKIVAVFMRKTRSRLPSWSVS
jgi:type II secretory pathway component PulF